MAREKKDGKYVNYYIDQQIYDRLKRYAADKGQSMTTAIERILDQYLPRIDGNGAEQSDARTSSRG